MDAMKAITSRHSSRTYNGEPLSKEQIKRIADAGRLAATARNEQPWELVAVTDRDLLAKIAELAEYGKFIADAGACIVVFCKDTTYYLEDGSAATQNMLVAANAMDVQSCWVAGDKKDYAAPIATLLKAPAGMKLVSLVALGHAEPREPTPKRPIDEVLHWESF